MENRFGQIITLEKTFQNVKQFARFWNGEEKNFRGWTLCKGHGACRWDKNFAQGMIDGATDWEVLHSPEDKWNGMRPSPGDLSESDFPIAVMYF